MQLTGYIWNLNNGFPTSPKNLDILNRSVCINVFVLNIDLSIAPIPTCTVAKRSFQRNQALGYSFLCHFWHNLKEFYGLQLFAIACTRGCEGASNKV